MHQMNQAAEHTATVTRSPAVRPIPGPGPRWVRVGRGTYPFTSYAAASAAYCATIERLGVGVSEVPVCALLDDAGNVVAQVTYNGRVFAVGTDGEADGSLVLHEPEAA